jgi:hypothetical protein|eukprot:COSAG06_NODE_1118_length_10635_cov_5.052946_6_plen_496_part_00
MPNLAALLLVRLAPTRLSANPTTATALLTHTSVAPLTTTLFASSIHVNETAAGRSHRWFPHFTAIPLDGNATALVGSTGTDDDGACGGEKPCLPRTHHISLDGGRTFSEIEIEGMPKFNTTRAMQAGRPKHGGGLNMFYVLPTGTPGQALVLPGSDSGLVNSDGTTGVHTDLVRGSAWSDAGGTMSVSSTGSVTFTPTRQNFTFTGFPRNTSCWPPNMYWRVIDLPDGKKLGTANAGWVGGAGGNNKAMVAVVSSDGGTNWRYLSTIANESRWPAVPHAEGMGEHSVSLTPSGRLVCVWRTNGGHHRAIGPSGPGVLPYNFSVSLDGSGLTWSDPRVMRDVTGYTMGSAQPQLLFVPGSAPGRKGVVLLAGGRSGSFLWHSPDGEHWSTLNLATAHNTLRSGGALPAGEPAALFTPPWTERDQPAAYNATQPPSWPTKGYYNPDCAQSTMYTSISAVGSSTVVLVYDRIGNGWWGPPGPFGSDDHVFAMRLQVSV